MAPALLLRGRRAAAACAFAFAFIAALPALALALSGYSAANTIASTSTSTVTAGNLAVIQITPQDSNDTLVTDGTLSFYATFTNTNTVEVVLTNLTATYNSPYYFFSSTFTVAANYSVVIVDGNGDAIGNSPFTLTIVAGEVSVASCTKTAAIYAQSWTAGLPNYMYVHFKDAFGNNVQLQASRLIAVASYVVQPAPPVVVTIAMESNNYIADINAYANRSGSVNFRLSLDSEPNNPFFNFVATVSPSLFSASQSYATLGAIANSHEPFTSVSYASKSASIQPCDAYGNTLNPLQVDTQNPGAFTCTLSLVSTPTAGASLGVVSTSVTTVNTGVISTSTSYSCSYGPLTIAGNYSLSIQRNGQSIKGSPFPLYLIPGDMNATTSYFANINSSYTKAVGSTYWFTLVTQDSFSNREISGGNGAYLIAQLTSISDPTNVYVVANVTDNNDGTYNCTYVLPSSGSFYLSAFYYDETINTTYTIVGYSPTSAANSLAYGAGITDCKARVTCRFIVQALDKFGNGNNAGDTVTVTLDGSTIGTITPGGNSLYYVQYTTTGSGWRSLGISINGAPINGSPYSIYVAPSDAAVGVIVAVVLLVVSFSLIIGYIVYKRKQIKKQQQEWARKKAAAYKEYQVDGSVPVPLAAQQNTKEPEWEDNDHWDEGVLQTDPAEWEAMQKWLQQKTGEPINLNPDAITDDIEMLDIASK